MGLEIFMERGITGEAFRELGMLVEVVFWLTTASDFLKPIFWFLGSAEITEVVLGVFPN